MNYDVEKLAFPLCMIEEGAQPYFATGLTKREYYAGQALIGAKPPQTDTDFVAKWCFEMADAMIAEGEKK